MTFSARLAAALTALMLLGFAATAWSEELPEYRLKAAILYNFVAFTEWPPEVGATLNLCILGKDPFGTDLDSLQGKPVGARHLAVHRSSGVESLNECQVVFVAGSAMGSLSNALARLRGQPVLTVADSPGAAAAGVALNMNIVNSRITFEANLAAARSAGVNLSSKLLRLATDVRQ